MPGPEAIAHWVSQHDFTWDKAMAGYAVTQSLGVAQAMAGFRT